MKKKVMFVVLPYLLEMGEVKSKLRSFKAFPYGVLSMASFLKKNADVEVFDCNTDDYMQKLENKLVDFQPDVVGLSMMFDNSYRDVGKIATLIRYCAKNATIVMGGMAAVSSYERILKEQHNIDAICYHEGELPMMSLIISNGINPSDASWITRDSLNRVICPEKSSVVNLDCVIDIDYSFIDIEDYAMREEFSPFAGTISNRKQFFLVTSRGCPFKCVFCMHSADPDKSMRYASIPAIMDHVEFLVKEYGMNVLTIYDDQLLLNRQRAKELSRELARFNIRIECPNGLSVAFMDEELIKLMREAGMDTVNLAIESGSPYVLNKIMHKPLKLNLVKPVVRLLRKYNFWIHAFFVLGIPGETDEHRKETVDFIKDVGFDWCGFGLVTPTRGTELFDICVEKGYIKGDMQVDELDANKYIINTPEYSADYMIQEAYKINLDVNFVNNYRMRVSDYDIAADSFKNVIKLCPDHAFAHYYLANAKFRSEYESLKEYDEIIKNDRTWKGLVECMIK